MIASALSTQRTSVAFRKKRNAVTNLRYGLFTEAGSSLEISRSIFFRILSIESSRIMSAGRAVDSTGLAWAGTLGGAGADF